MKEFNIDLLNEQKLFGSKKRQCFKITLKNQKPNIDVDDVESIVNTLTQEYEEKGMTNVRICVVGMNIHRRRTLKGFDQAVGDIDIKQYYESSVKDPNKFTKFSQLQLTVNYDAPKKSKK